MKKPPTRPDDDRPLTDAQRALVEAFIADYGTPLKIVKTQFRAQYFATVKLRIPEADLEQLAYVGVIKAARNFRPGHLGPRSGLAAKFATYAAWWVRAALSKAIIAADRDIRTNDTCARCNVTDFKTVLARDDRRDDECPDELELVRVAVGKLDAKFRTVLGYRYGYGGKPLLTLNEIGVRLGYTKERIRQLQNEGLDRLRRGVENERRLLLTARAS